MFAAIIVDGGGSKSGKSEEDSDRKSSAEFMMARKGGSVVPQCCSRGISLKQDGGVGSLFTADVCWEWLSKQVWYWANEVLLGEEEIDLKGGDAIEFLKERGGMEVCLGDRGEGDTVPTAVSRIGTDRWTVSRRCQTDEYWGVEEMEL